jgi:autotransporter translocation and assembly factor TamB
MSRPPLWRAARALMRLALYTTGAVLALLGLLVVVLETSWGIDRLRRLIVDQANRFLAAELSIDRMDGSLLRGVSLEGIRLALDGRAVVFIERVDVGYSLRQLRSESGTIIRRLEVVKPHVVAERDADGRWNLGSLLRSRGPGGGGLPALAIDTIEVTGAAIELRSPVTFGAVRAPSAMSRLDARLAFQSSRADGWRVAVDHASWEGRAPDLTVTELSGTVTGGAGPLTFEQFRVVTPLSAFVLSGTVTRQPPPTVLDLTVEAERFAFQEWAGVVSGLRNIAIESAFTTRLAGPTRALETTLDLRSNGGSVRGTLTLDTSVPGWHGAGQLEISHLNLARWMNSDDQRSDITGRVTFDLDLELGRRFPRGRYRFAGRHVAYLGYAGDDLVASGTLTEREALITRATATAYGANLLIDSGAIGLSAPFTYRFAGVADGLDLRRLPDNVPVPHVESTLAFEYDVQGRFRDPHVVGRAWFHPSTFLDVAVGEGAVGTIDTSVRPFRYTGEGALGNIVLQRLGAGLDIDWMRDPRYAGMITGRFRVDGSGADAATMTIDAGGRLDRAELFHGVLSGADVTLTIADGTLRARYAGALSQVNPAIALDDRRLDASVTGRAELDLTVRDLLVRETSLDDYEIAGRLLLGDSTVRGLRLLDGELAARLAERSLELFVQVDGPRLSGRVDGQVSLDGAGASRLEYVHTWLDLAAVGEWFGRPVSGTATGRGVMTGSLDAPALTGTARVSLLAADALDVLETAVDYGVVVPLASPGRSTVEADIALAGLTVAGRILDGLAGTITLDDGRLGFDARLIEAGRVEVESRGELGLHRDDRLVDIMRLTLAWRGLAWQKTDGGPTTVGWDETGFTLSPLSLTDRDSGEQRLTVSGRWGSDRGSGVTVSATGVFLDAFASLVTPAGQFGGTLDAVATVRPSPDGAPAVTLRGTVTSGRVRRLPFDQLSAQIEYAAGVIDLDSRLDQGPGVWVTAAGRVPLALLDRGGPEAPMHMTFASSAIDLSLVEGVTDVVRDLSGQLRLDVTVVGTTHDPHVEGAVDVTDAAFAVRATGARYRNGRAVIRLASDRVDVETLRIEDARGRALTVTGSLATHELKVGDFAVEVVSSGIEVLRNEFGTVEVETALSFRGQFESPKVTGIVTITGGMLNVDRILDRTLLRPYATESAPPPSRAGMDALTALNPWDRIGLDIAVRTRGTLRMVGENVQVSPGTPLGLGNIALRAYGDIYLYKDPASQLFVTGTLDSLVGTYAFQGRRFDIDPDSSVIFRGDLNPELYVTVRREISAVEARVSIVGPLNEPELRLASTPQLDASDILALIVFNTQLNQLSTGQQQELAVRAGTLAAGFLAAPLINALERSLGLDILEIEPPRDTAGTGLSGPRVTIGDEIAPGLVARFSRQFGRQEYNEAIIEYYLSRLFRIRATFSDAGSVLASRFRRVERAGIDFLIFFSF